MGQDVSDIGQSIVIKGDVKASEDLTVEGRVSGSIDLASNVLTIGPTGRTEADLMAKEIVVEGTATGNLVATERLKIGQKAKITGDLIAPKVVMAEGATFKGKIDMSKKPEPSTAGR